MLFDERFEILKPLGQGGGGRVFLAYDNTSHRNVALKIAPPGDPLAQKRLLHEAKLLAQLQHPHIVQLLQHGQSTDKTAWLTTESLDGKKLSDIIAEHRGLPSQLALPIFEKICHAVIYLHRHDIIHCDLKPANIFVDHNQNIKIIDFGIAKDLKTTTSKYNNEEKPVGTAGYVSPEQILGNNDVDSRSDIYALGAVLAFMLTGQQPFSARTRNKIMALQLTKNPTVLSHAIFKQNQTLYDVIATAMARDKHARYQTVEQLLKALN